MSVWTDTKLLLHFNGVNGSKEVLDDGNTGHIVTQVGTAQLSTAQKKFGNASLLLDGDSDYIQMPDHADYDIGANTWTVEAWVRFKSASGSQCLFNFGGYNGGLALIYSGTYTSWEIETAAGGGYIGDSWTPTLNQWYHIAFTGTGSGRVRLFIDGVQSGANMTLAYNIACSDNPRIGCKSTELSWLFNGYIDEFRFSRWERYETTFTPSATPFVSDSYTKLLLHLNSQDVNSNITHIPTFYNHAQLATAQKEFGSASIVLDGSDDYVRFPDSTDWDVAGNITDSWTIDLWVKHNSYSGNQAYVFHNDEAMNNGWFLYNSSGNGLRFYVESGGGHKVHNTSWNSDVADNNWHHIAMIKKANIIGIYKDGTQVSYGELDSPGFVFRGKTLDIGRTCGGSASYMNGWIDEVRINNGNPFNGNPNSGRTNTITVPTREYSAGYANKVLSISGIGKLNGISADSIAKVIGV